MDCTASRGRGCRRDIRPYMILDHGPPTGCPGASPPGYHGAMRARGRGVVSACPGRPAAFCARVWHGARARVSPQSRWGIKYGYLHGKMNDWNVTCPRPIIRQAHREVKTGIRFRAVYDKDVPPPAEQLGEPSRFSREPTQSHSVQVSFVVKDAGRGDEGAHLVEVGSFT